jgi:hypothetical protein
MGARALLAFQRGESSRDAMLGALMWTEFQSGILVFLEKYVEANKKASRKR